MTAEMDFAGENGQKGEKIETSQPSVAGTTFDQWLTHHLRQLYDPVVVEPLPADLIRLLEQKLG